MPDNHREYDLGSCIVRILDFSPAGAGEYAESEALKYEIFVESKRAENKPDMERIVMSLRKRLEGAGYFLSGIVRYDEAGEHNITFGFEPSDPQAAQSKIFAEILLDVERAMQGLSTDPNALGGRS